MFLPAQETRLAYDDTFMLHHVQGFDHWTDAFRADAFRLYRPFKNLFYLGIEATGGDVRTYHAVTFGFYLFGALGLFFLARRLTDHDGWGLAAAALWTFSACNTTVAVWPTCANISFAVGTLCLGLVAWDRWRENPTRHGSLAAFILLALLGLFSYETSVAIAPLAVLLDLYRDRRVLARGALARYAGIALLVGAWLLVRHFGGADSSSAANPSLSPETERWQLSASAPYFLWTHLTMWAAPWGKLEVLGSYIWDKSVPAIVMPFCWLMLLGVAALCIRFWRPGNLLVFGLAWFLAASFPSGNFIPLGNTPYADYYTTLPAVGLCLALVAVLRALAGVVASRGLHHRAGLAATAALVLLVGWRAANLTEQRNWTRAWASPVEVMARTAAARPYQYLAKTAVANELSQRGSFELAEWYARAAIEDAPWLASNYITLAEVALDDERPEDAVAHLERAVETQHLSAFSMLKTHLRMGQALGRDPESSGLAFEHFRIVLREHDSPYHLEAIHSAAAMFASHDRRDDQRTVLKRGLEIHPGEASLVEALAEAEKPRAEAAADPS